MGSLGGGDGGAGGGAGVAQETTPAKTAHAQKAQKRSEGKKRMVRRSNKAIDPAGFEPTTSSV
jgi:hypothetical protein